MIGNVPVGIAGRGEYPVLSSPRYSNQNTANIKQGAGIFSRRHLGSSGLSRYVLSCYLLLSRCLQTSHGFESMGQRQQLTWAAAGSADMSILSAGPAGTPSGSC